MKRAPREVARPGVAGQRVLLPCPRTPSKVLTSKKVYVMLSAAKHLLFLVENKQKQTLRLAQDDMRRGFFHHQPARLQFAQYTDAACRTASLL